MGNNSVKNLAGIVDYNMLCYLLEDYKRPRDKISELIKNKDILRIKKGLYLSNSSKGSFEPEFLANLIYGPSYISKEKALSFYGLIPERVYEYTCITLAKKKTFETPIGRFTYQPVPLPYYSEGIVRYPVGEDGGGFLVASKEKALCDLLYSKSFENLSDFKDYLKELRIEKSDLKKLNKSILKRLASLSNRDSLKFLCSSLEKMKV